MNIDFNVVRTIARRCAPTTLLVGMVACGGNIDPSHESSGSPADDQALGMSFATEQEAFAFIARRAKELGIDVRTRENAEGNLVGVTGLSVGSTGEVGDKRDQLLREIGGAERALRIAGKRYALDPQGESDLVTTAQALCSGSFCTSHQSFRNNYLFYREIGSRTNVTAGGTEFRRQTLQGQPYVDCFDGPGPGPLICQNKCSFSQNCPAGLTQESFVPYPTCRKVCSGNVLNVTLTLTAEAFEFLGGVLTPSFGQTKTNHDTSLEVNFSEWIIPGTDTAISSAAGLCGTHVSVGPGGAFVSGHSHVGSVPSSCL